jgi:glycosyltransferase involved in cell wall biosynthesis
VVGDAPTLSTGLGRIARDLTARIARYIPEVRVAQLGLKYSGAKVEAEVGGEKVGWHCYPIRDEENWGQHDIAAAWEDHDPLGRGGIVLTVWDPGRCPAMVWGLEAAFKTRWRAEGRRKPELWGYFAVDADDSRGALGGPVAETLARGYQRILGYSRFGSEVLERTLALDEHAGRAKERVEWLPHGIDARRFYPREELPEGMQPAWAKSPWPVVGAVASNTPRKDWGMVFAALAGVKCHLWVHTDRLVTAAWSFPELAVQFGRDDPGMLHVSGVEGPLEDEELARWYSVCSATIAPGAGEGFGYPGVESLACGTPVVGVDYAAGPEFFLPQTRWRVRPVGYRLDGAYALRRPVVDPGKVRDAVAAAIRWREEEPKVVREYCRGAVAHMRWEDLWPWWERWIREGIEGRRAGAAASAGLKAVRR